MLLAGGPIRSCNSVEAIALAGTDGRKGKKHEADYIKTRRAVPEVLTLPAPARAIFWQTSVMRRGGKVDGVEDLSRAKIQDFWRDLERRFVKYILSDQIDRKGDQGLR